MTKELNKKIDEMVDRFYNGLQTYVHVDLLDEGTETVPLEVKRDPFALEDFIHGYRTWQAANKQLIDYSAEKYGDIVEQYFKFVNKKDGKYDFGILFFNIMNEKIARMSAREITGYLNDLAKAIIVKEIDIRVMNRIIDLSSND